ncbi:MAG: hypothetical protein WD602_03245 [Actinomycetota bacterium]
MEALASGEAGVVVYRGVPLRSAADQHATAYLRIRGAPRDLPSHRIHVYMGDQPVTPATGKDHPAFAGSFAAYNSPPVPGAARAASPSSGLPEQQAPYEVQVDISAAADAMAPGDATADVTLVMTDGQGRPLDAASFLQENLEITLKG